MEDTFTADLTKYWLNYREWSVWGSILKSKAGFELSVLKNRYISVSFVIICKKFYILQNSQIRLNWNRFFIRCTQVAFSILFKNSHQLPQCTRRYQFSIQSCHLQEKKTRRIQRSALIFGEVKIFEISRLISASCTNKFDTGSMKTFVEQSYRINYYIVIIVVIIISWKLIKIKK